MSTHHIIGQLNLACLLAFTHQRTALRRRTRGGVCDGQKRKNTTEDYGGFACAISGVSIVTQWVAGRRLMRMVAHSRDDQVGTVRCDHGRLCEPRAGVVFLDERVHADDRGENTECEIEGDEEAVESAPGASEVGIEYARECDSECVHGCCGADKNPLP